MRRLLLLLALLLLAAPALAFRLGTTVSSSNCPNGTAYADGCPGAPAWSTVINPGFFTGVGGTLAPQSGQPAYQTRPPWNVAGVDYKVGAAATAGLADPATATLPSGCTYHAGGGNNVSYITCSVAGNLTLSGLNLSAINGHNCTMIDLWASSIGGSTVNIQNVSAKWNSTNCGYQWLCVHAACSSNPGVNGVAGYSLWVLGNSIDWTPPTQGTDLTDNYHNPSMDIISSSNVYIEYNYILNTQCRFDSLGIPQGGAAGTSTAGAFVHRFNYMWQQDYECDQTHVEISQISTSGDVNGNATLSAWNNDFNTIQLMKGFGQSWFAFFGDVLQPGNYATITNGTFNNNTQVTNTATDGTVNKLNVIGQAQYGSLQVNNNYLDRYNGGLFLGCINGPNHHNPSDHTGTGGTILPWTTSYPVIGGNVNLVSGNAETQDQIVNVSSCQPYGITYAGGVIGAWAVTSTPSVTLNSVTAGDALCIAWHTNGTSAGAIGSNGNTTAITDNYGDTFTIAANAGQSSFGWDFIACATNVHGGNTTVTANMTPANCTSGSCAALSIIDEFSSTAGTPKATGVETGAGTYSSTTGTDVSSGNWNMANGHLIYAFVVSATTYTVGPGSGFTTTKQDPNYRQFQSEFALLTPNGTAHATAAVTAGNNVVLAVSLK